MGSGSNGQWGGGGGGRGGGQWRGPMEGAKGEGNYLLVLNKSYTMSSAIPIHHRTTQLYLV